MTQQFIVSSVTVFPLTKFLDYIFVTLWKFLNVFDEKLNHNKLNR